MNRESSTKESTAPSNKSTARAIRAHPSAARDRSPVDQLRQEQEQPVVGSPRLDAKGGLVRSFIFSKILINYKNHHEKQAQDSLAGTEARGVPLNTKWTFWLDK